MIPVLIVTGTFAAANNVNILISARTTSAGKSWPSVSRKKKELISAIISCFEGQKEGAAVPTGQRMPSKRSRISSRKSEAFPGSLVFFNDRDVLRYQEIKKILFEHPSSRFFECKASHASQIIVGFKNPDVVIYRINP